MIGDVSVEESDMSSASGRALRSKFPEATYVVDGFHVVQAANRTVNETRRRVQQKQRGHRGRKADPLHRSRKLGHNGEERLDKDSRSKFHEWLAAGDLNREDFESCTGKEETWAGKEAVRKTYDLDAEDA